MNIELTTFCSLITPIAFHHIGYRTFIIFAVINAIIIPTVYFFYPETGCRSLEEVDVLFSHASNSSKPWTDVVRIAKKEPLWYGKDGETAFNYVQSDWHQHFAQQRHSDERSTSTDATPDSHGYGSTDSPQKEKYVR